MGAHAMPDNINGNQHGDSAGLVQIANPQVQSADYDVVDECSEGSFPASDPDAGFAGRAQHRLRAARSF